MDHESWKSSLKTEGSDGHRVFLSRPFLKELFELAAVFLFESGLESGGEWWEWGRLTKLEEAEMTKESQIDHADDKYAEFARDNMEAFVKRLVQAYERSSQALGNFPAQFFPKRIIIRTFLAFVLADRQNVPVIDKMKKLVVRTLCNLVVDDKSDKSLDSISGPIQMFKGASLKGPLSTGVFDFERVPEWHIKHTLCSEQVNAWVSMLWVLNADTSALNCLVADQDGSNRCHKRWTNITSSQRNTCEPQRIRQTSTTSTLFKPHGGFPAAQQRHTGLSWHGAMYAVAFCLCVPQMLCLRDRTPHTGRQS